MFYNQSENPVTIKSVSLLKPHNLALRGATVYTMLRSRYPLPLEWSWQEDGAPYVPESQWNLRTQAPGTVIPAEDGKISSAALNSKAPDLYEIAVGASLESHANGWALGEVVTYEQSGKTYTLKYLTGMAISVATPETFSTSCNQPVATLKASFGLT